MERLLPTMLTIGKRKDRPSAKDYGRMMYLAYDEKTPTIYYSDGNDWVMEFHFAKKSGDANG